MSWLHNLIKRLTVAPPPVDDEEMRRLRERTETGLAADWARDSEVREISHRASEQLRQNHFGPIIWAALRGEPDV